MYRRLGLLIILGLSFMPGLAREFPVCMYNVSQEKAIPLLKKAGFTCIQSYERNPAALAPLAQAASKRGLKTVFHPQEVWGTEYEKEAARWPMLAWYLVDEPDVAKWSRERVQEAYEKTKTAWPHHSTTLVIGQGRTKVPYYDIPDGMMVDWYPVPHLELTSFGDNVAWTREGMQMRGAGDRPLWGVVQIFDWKEFKQYRPDNDRIGRFPTENEIRFMMYDGIANGATGLFFFHFNSFGKPLPQANPEWWSRVTIVTKEFKKMRPVLEKGILIENPVTITSPLTLKTWKYKRHTYSLLLNRSKHEQPVPAELLSKEYKLFIGKQKTVNIPPYAVWVLKKHN